MKKAKPTKPKKGCDCVTAVNKELKAFNMELDTDFQIKFSTGTVSLSPPKLATRKLEKSKKPMKTLYPAFCPFCGKKYPK